MDAGTSGTPGTTTLVASATWSGGCGGVAAGVRFLTAGGRSVMLEAGSDAGEESPEHTMSTVWLLDGERLVGLGDVLAGLEDTRDSSAVGGFMRKMTATIDGTDTGLRVREAWSFTPVAAGGGAAHDKTREYVLKIEAGQLTGARPPELAP